MTMANFELFVDSVPHDSRASFGTPRMTHEIRPGYHVLGPWYFHITIEDPSDEVRAMVRDGTAHEVKIVADGQFLSLPVRFIETWDEDGITRVFGHYEYPQQHTLTWRHEIPTSVGA